MGSDDDITEPSEGAGDAINDDIGREEAILGPEWPIEEGRDDDLEEDDEEEDDDLRWSIGQLWYGGLYRTPSPADRLRSFQTDWDHLE